MTRTGRIRTSGRRRAFVCAALLATGLTFGLGANAIAGSDVDPFGYVSPVPKAACPQSPCQAIGNVSGFQTRAPGRRQPHQARHDGRIVSWAIKLADPSASQEAFFRDLYEHGSLGTDSVARLGVIRRIPSGPDEGKYKLLRQSERVSLEGTFGTTQYFTLNEPLRIKEGQTLILTVPTWAAAFAVNQPRANNSWRASRNKGKCRGVTGEGTETDPFVPTGSPHENLDTIRRYDCSYRTARLLYWGYWVRD